MSEFALGDQEIRDIDGTLATLAAATDPVELRFANHWPDDDESPALLAAALMGSLEGKDVTVDAVDEEAVDGLLRFGVATALSRRDEDLTRFTGLATRLDRESLRTLWTPAALDATQALFADLEPKHTGVYGRFHATFVNPHFSADADGHPDVVFLIRRWLTKRLSERAALDSQAARPLVEAIGGVVDELVRNVQEHAAGPQRPDPNCLLRISLDSAEEIRCSILDTGIGLSESLDSKEIERGLAAEDRIAKLISNEIPDWDAGRGTGLAFAAELIAACHGSFAVANDRVRVRRSNGEAVRRGDGFALQGTVVDITVPVPTD